MRVRLVRRYPGSPLSEQYRLRVWRSPGWQALLRLPFGLGLSIWRKP